MNGCIFGKCFVRTFFGLELSKGTFDETKMVTCCAKGYSNLSRLNKNVSHNKVLGEERKH